MSTPIESPCVNVCQLNDVNFNNPETHCLGCYRSVAEIASWGRMTPLERANVMQALPARKLAMQRSS